MKTRVTSVGFIVFTVVLTLILSGCPSPLLNQASTVPSADATIAVDPARGLVVLTESNGDETPITAAEADGFIGCEEVTDYVLFDSESDGRFQFGSRQPRAIILGVRSDGRPGVWIVYPGGIVVVPEGDSGDKKSELLEAVSEADSFCWDDGWDYTAKELSEDGRIIVGVAENPDAAWLADYLDTTPKVVVWWNLVDKGDGVFYLSRARVVAEYPDWGVDDVKSDRNGRGHRWNRHARYWLKWFLDRLGLWFFAWADNYLGDLAEDPLAIESVGTYSILGYDKEGDYAKAVITPYKVLSIEKTDPPVVPGEPAGPFPVIGPDSESLIWGTFFPQSFDLITGAVDPNLNYRDVVSFESPNIADYSFLTLETVTTPEGVIGRVTATNAPAQTESYTLSIIFYTVDAKRVQSDPFTVDITFNPYSGGGT